MAGQEGMWQGGKSNKQTSTLADKLKANNKIFLPLNSSGAMAEMNHKWLVCTGLPHLQIFLSLSLRLHSAIR